MDDNQRDDFHFYTIALTFGSAVTFAILWRPHLVRVAMGSVFIVVVLVTVYVARWRWRRQRGEPADAMGASWRSVIPFYFLGFTAWLVNGGARICAIYEESPEPNPTMLGGLLVAECVAMLWFLASVCWGCVAAYLALHRAWSAAGAALGAVLLGTLSGTINWLWLWN